MKKYILFFLIVFMSHTATASYILQDTTNGCTKSFINIDSNNHSNMFSMFTRNEHTCTNGYFLPAGVDECRICPTEHNCDGGIYRFNENISQGITWTTPFKQSATNGCVADLVGIDTNNHSTISAIFTPNEHTCTAGYYLPMNIDECVICPADYLCVGGTYTFNETTDQGIVACPAGYYAPAGSDRVCYPHILHVGNDNVYLTPASATTPSLNVRIGEDVFYANMTTTQTYMNKDTKRYLRIKYNDTDYYVCDDTICPQ